MRRSVAAQSWDGTFRRQPGDFFFNAELEFMTKNGRANRRDYHQHVALRPDGSAPVATSLFLTNTDPPDSISGLGSLAYVTVYGPGPVQPSIRTSPDPGVWPSRMQVRYLMPQTLRR